MLWKTFGHESAKRLLERQLSNGRFPHAYLFSGPAGIGKKTLALEFARKILKTERLDTSADLLMLDEAGEITVEALRNFLPRLSLKPLGGDKKVAVINNADRMNIQSANALLKTLEEPSPSTVIILVGDGQRLLGTIRSRCQNVPMQLFSREQLKSLAKVKNIDTDEDAIDLSFGLPSELVRLSEDAGYFSEKQGLVKKWRQLRSASVAERLLSIGELAEMETEELQNALLTWVYGEEFALFSDPRQFPALSALTEAYLGLLSNQNKKSVLQELFLKI